MNRILRATLVLILALAMICCAVGLADGTISTKMIMRVSKITQKAVVNIGEDLSLEVSIDGVEPASYQWYFNDEPIAGADQNVCYLNNAQLEQSGVYRINAFDSDGKMLVSMDVNVRVIDPTVPKSGDDSMPVGIAAAVFAMAAAALAVTIRRKVKA